MADRLEAHVRGRAAAWRGAVEYLVAPTSTLVAGGRATHIIHFATTSLDSAVRGGIRAGAVGVADIAGARIAVVAVGIVLLADAADALQTAIDAAWAIRV